MAVITSWLVKRTIFAKNPADRALVFYLLVTMASMFGGAVIYLVSPSLTSIVEAVGLNAVLMTGGIIVVLRYWAERYIDEAPTQSLVLSDSKTVDSETAERRVKWARYAYTSRCSFSGNISHSVK